ncbi:unnamed protein product, partial [Polarella glacialis]
VRARGLSLRLTFARCGLRFVLPLELWPEAAGPLPASELCLAMLLWAAPPLLIRVLRGGYLTLREAMSSKQASIPPKAKLQGDGAGAAGVEMAEALEQRALVSREAARRRAEEEARNGLVILFATYGEKPTDEDSVLRGSSVLDVTDCLQARVRQSQLHISDAPKATLLGFCRLASQGDAASGLSEIVSEAVLQISYRFGAIEYSRTFGDRDPVILP